MKLVDKIGTCAGYVTRMTARILVVGFFFLMSACQDAATIWSEEIKSPDGYWIASARTEQYGGPGTASVQTTVYLKWSNGSQKPIEILSFSNDSAYPPGITSVKMNWMTPSHLDVAYKQGANLDFQAVKCAGIEISVQNLSGKATNGK